MLMWVYKIIVSKILVDIITHDVFEDLDYLRSEAYWSIVISSKLRSFFKYRYNICTLPVVSRPQSIMLKNLMLLGISQKIPLLCSDSFLLC